MKDSKFWIVVSMNDIQMPLYLKNFEIMENFIKLSWLESR